MGNRRNRRTRRNESQSPERDENMSETSLLQGNATLTNVSENVNNVFDRNLGSELTEPSQISNEIEIISQRLSEQNSNKMTQIEHQLNSKFEEILKEIRANKNCNTITDEEDVESRQPGPSNSKPKGLRNKHASNMTIERDQDDRFYPSEMSELRQPYTPIGITDETLDETIIINENRQENADHHTGHTIIPGYSQIFLDLPGRTINPGSGEKKKKIIKLWFCGFIFVGLFSIFLMQFMELTVHSK